MLYGKVNRLAWSVVVAGMMSHTVLADSLSAGDEQETDLGTVVVTAQEALLQMPGVSVITAEEVEKRAPVNDLSDVIRRMPGVNLTGNGSTGQRGNNRQIDLRGMGPENTLILIDGKPVSSRNSVKYGRSGERDTRGDTNWIPASEVERIEVIRGPAAARYGSGAAGGIVNIITKDVAEETHGSVTVYANQPQHIEEGYTRRISGNLSGPISEDLSYRLAGSLNKTSADHGDINADETLDTAATAAGREGVRNTDLSGMLRWKAADNQAVDVSYSYSRQSNIYAGDTLISSSATDADSTSRQGVNIGALLGHETNRVSRFTYSAEHRGNWDFGTTKTYLQYEKTENRRLGEGAVGGTEGIINTLDGYSTSTMQDYIFHSEMTTAARILGLGNTITAGAEVNYQILDDGGNITNSQLDTSGLDGVEDSAADRDTENSATITSIFIEDRIQVGGDLEVIPGLRADHHSDSGTNLSPSLNASYLLTDTLTLKGGIARAFKAPNLYQSFTDYVYTSRGNGCNLDDKTIYGTSGCYILGNDDLDPETSVNKELGINWHTGGWNAGITWFRNDYTDKIVAGDDVVGTISTGSADYSIYQWENAQNAVVEGYEGNLKVPVSDSMTWTTNATWMRRNYDQDRQPLSIIPKYTVNSMYDWQISDSWNAVMTATFYGEQVPRTVTYNTGEEITDADARTRVEPYSIWGVGAGYSFSENWKCRFGVNNILDRRIYRLGNSSGAGAATYNEPGRSYYLSITASM